MKRPCAEPVLQLRRKGAVSEQYLNLMKNGKILDPGHLFPSPVHKVSSIVRRSNSRDETYGSITYPGYSQATLCTCRKRVGCI